jgi:hypothetical protein
MTVAIKFDTSVLNDVAEDLAMLDIKTIRELRESTVEVVSLSVRKAAIAQTTKELNLSASYVEDKLERVRGKREVNRTQDSIVSEIRGTTMQRFGAGMTQRMTPVKFPNTKVLEIAGKKNFVNGVVRGPRATLPNGKSSSVWTERTGDKWGGRNIPRDLKADGLMVAVKRGSPRLFPHAFWLKLNRGNTAGDNGYGMFSRPKGGGDPVHLYGPSVYQVFRRYAEERRNDIAQEMQDHFLNGLDAKLKGL